MVYTQIPNPTTPTYNPLSPGGLYIFDDPNVLFDDTVVQFDGNDDIYTATATPTSPTYASAPAPTNP